MTPRFHRSAILETIIFLLVLVAINLVFFKDLPAYQTVSPHPYLVVIVLIATLYGVKEGLLAAFIATVFFLANLQWAKGLELREIFSTIPQIKILAFFWISGFVLGEIREIHNRKIRQLENDQKELKEKFEDLNTQYEAVKTVKEELDSRIIGQTPSVVSLYEAAKALETLEREKIYDSLVNLSVKFLGAERCSLFIVDEKNSSLKLVAEHNWEEEKKIINRNEGIVGWVAHKGNLLTILDIERNDELQKLIRDDLPTPMLSAPVLVHDKIVGVLSVEKIPFTKLHASTTRLMSIICELASPALENALMLTQAKEADIWDELTGLLKFTHFVERYEEEFKRTVRYGLNFSLSMFQIDNYEQCEKEYGTEGTNIIMQRTAQLTKEALRSIDIFSLDQEPGSFFILLPVTDVEGGLIALERLRNRIRTTSLSLNGKEIQLTASFGLSGYQSGIDDKEVILERARRACTKAKGAGGNKVELSTE